ncbi:MAG TPA: hypothetical protein VFV58_15280 [Blastocatellia bacterium]|jgi:hypothetical protein|nr:hypothetical protein [Blastocatellia bacterium]
MNPFILLLSPSPAPPLSRSLGFSISPTFFLSIALPLFDRSC